MGWFPLRSRTRRHFTRPGGPRLLGDLDSVSPKGTLILRRLQVPWTNTTSVNREGRSVIRITLCTVKVSKVDLNLNLVQVFSCRSSYTHSDGFCGPQAGRDRRDYDRNEESSTPVTPSYLTSWGDVGSGRIDGTPDHRP